MSNQAPVADDEFVLRRVAAAYYDPTLPVPVQRDAFLPWPRDITGLSVFRERYIRPEEIVADLPPDNPEFVMGVFGDFTGMPEEQSLGDGWLLPVHPDDKERSYQRWRAAVEAGTPFENEYRRLYSRVIPGVEVEILSWVLLLSAPVTTETAIAVPLPAPYSPEPLQFRSVFDPEIGEFIDVAIHERRSLNAGALIPGPAVIVEDETSTVVSRLFDARIDAFGYIELTRR